MVFSIYKSQSNTIFVSMILEYKKANIFYTDQGKGAAVVLIHGFLENSTMWGKITSELIKKNRVITIDLLGHGKSDCLGYSHSMEVFSETIEAVLKHIRIRKCIFGWSFFRRLCCLGFCSEKSSENKRLVFNEFYFF